MQVSPHHGLYTTAAEYGVDGVCPSPPQCHRTSPTHTNAIMNMEALNPKRCAPVAREDMLLISHANNLLVVQGY
jgi:hypothetical protein